VLDLPGLMARLDKQIRRAKQVPLTDQVRVDKEEMRSTLEEMRTEATRVGLTAALPPIAELDAALRDAMPVPLTDQVRLPKENLEKIADEIRVRVSPAGN
jgi:hypothetical protein